jgi:hypothetical protein
VKFRVAKKSASRWTPNGSWLLKDAVQQAIEAILGSSKTGRTVSPHTFSTAPHSSPH